ncbi:MAG: hypothetical protein QOE70_3967 [Chthoniobacter sp.]|jgi:hypothetical protein|nr:hypothetical protein [Chthoniobacter sp.]
MNILPHAVRSALLLMWLASSTQAKFKSPELVPVDRLVKNAESYLAKNPDDADAHYTLARIHYLAFSLKRDQAPAFLRGEDEGGKPRVAPQWMLGWVRSGEAKAAPLSSEELIDHATKALRSFHEALRLEATNGLYQLGLASLLEELSLWGAKAKQGKLPAEVRGITVKDYRDAYAKAFALAMAEDSKLSVMPLPGVGSITSYEAAAALIRLAMSTQNQMSDREKRELQRAEEAMAQFQKLPMGAITPLVFSFQPAAHLGDLLAPETVVNFDLRGYGARECWPWVKPKLGFLVWDPLQTGSIDSARQLFGGYTFQIFWKTGYDALSALDDNADGVLSGPELDGISVWFDRNSDGHSTGEEVTPLRELGVMSLAARAESCDGAHPTNARGLTLRDGRLLRTWDWIVAPSYRAIGSAVSESAFPLASQEVR